MEKLLYEMLDNGCVITITRLSTEFVTVDVENTYNVISVNGNTIENALQQIKLKAPWTTR